MESGDVRGGQKQSESLEIGADFATIVEVTIWKGLVGGSRSRSQGSKSCSSQLRNFWWMYATVCSLLHIYVKGFNLTLSFSGEITKSERDSPKIVGTHGPASTKGTQFSVKINPKGVEAS